jgi:ribonucleoside-triphosphate reductase
MSEIAERAVAQGSIKREIPWGEIGYITFKRTYARRLKEGDPNSKSEEFEQVVERELKACKEQLGINFTEKEKELYYNTRTQFKWSVAGRFMWQLGTKTVEKLGLPSLQNCAACVVKEPIRPFTWAFEMLMLGSGVGYNIQRQNVYQLPKLKGKIKITRQDANDVDFIVPDNREGWVKLLGKVLKAHFYSGEGFTYSAASIRGKGALIKGFGGTASGSEDLCNGIELIHNLLNNRAGKKLRPIDCLDIMNIIGAIVVSGNVRRSAQIAIGDYDDFDYLAAKRWDLGTIPNWRSMSNNSIACNDISKLPQQFWDTYEQGEPYGLINLDLARSCGRIGEVQYPDPNVEIFNPCAEQGLEDKETCCLAEVYLPNIESYKQLLECLTLAYRVCKHSLRLKCSLKDTEATVHKNMRMGIGMTGVLQATEEQKNWLTNAYEYLREFDKDYSKLNQFPKSIKLTTCKPSGTLSLLPRVTTNNSKAGVITPGVHPNPAGPFYIRRIRISSDSNLIKVCKDSGYKVEHQIKFDGTNDLTTMVVEFPCKVSEETPVAANYTWKQQLEAVKWLQKNWSDNSVSCTVYYNREDLEDIKKYLLENYKDNFKTLSFLLYQGHGFIQAPYETITKEQYYEAIKNTKPITSVEVNEEDFDILDCESGACPIK